MFLQFPSIYKNISQYKLVITYTIIRRRQWHPTPVLLPGKYHRRRSLVGCSPWGCEESDTTEQLHFHFSLSCIGEGNGTPLQCSCLENPRDGGAWWAAVSGVAHSQTRLKRLSSSHKVLLYSKGNSAQCYAAAWMGREFGEEWIHVYIWLSPFAVHLKL